MLYKYNHKQKEILVYFLHVLVLLYLELNDDTSEIMRITSKEMIEKIFYIRNCIHKYQTILEDYEHEIQLDELKVHLWVFQQDERYTK